MTVAELGIESVGAERRQAARQAHIAASPRPDDYIASTVIPLIREAWQQRQDLLRTEKRLENQCRATLIRFYSAGVELDGWEPPKEVKAQAAAMLKLHRRKRFPVMDETTGHEYMMTGELLAPFLAALRPISDALAEREKELTALAGELPIAEWIDATPGYSLVSLAGIVGFAGDLSRFPTPGKLEIMMSIGFVGGERQRRVSGDSEKATAMRFSPSRRALLYTLAQGAVMNKLEPWYTIYANRKAHEETTRPKLTKGHRDESAKRVLARRMLLAVWREWRRERGMYHWSVEVEN